MTGCGSPGRSRAPSRPLRWGASARASCLSRAGRPCWCSTPPAGGPGMVRGTTLAFHRPSDGSLVVVGGAGGQARTPDWVANLRASPHRLDQCGPSTRRGPSGGAHVLLAPSCGTSSGRFGLRSTRTSGALVETSPCTSCSRPEPAQRGASGHRRIAQARRASRTIAR